jgi:choice-of-anchor B domain-containing protein
VWFFLAIATCTVTEFAAAPCRAEYGDITLLGQITPVGADQFCQVWGFERGDRNYAVIGDWDSGPIIIDTTDPANPFVRKIITGTGVFGFDVKVWRNYLYVTEGGFGHANESSRAIDISIFDAPIVSAAFMNHHGFAIHPDGYLFAEIPGLRVYDLNADPTPAAHAWYDNKGNGHDSTVDVDYDRLYDYHGFGGTFIWNIANPTSPQLLGSIIDPTITYSHSGDNTLDGTHLFVCDELATGVAKDLTVWDITNPASPTKVGSYNDLTATIHNLYIVGPLAFVSYYSAGFRVFDVSNPATPILLDTFDTAPAHTGEGYDGCYSIYPYAPGGVVYVTDFDNGLYVFGVEGFTGLTAVGDTPAPASGRLLASYPNPFNPATTIAYELDRDARVALAVYDTRGHLVRVLSDGRAQAGRHETRWDGIDEQGLRAASGVYFVRLTMDAATDTGRLVLLK